MVLQLNNNKMKNLIFLLLSITISVLIITNSYAQTETKIPQDSLPAIVHNELHKKYATYAVNSILKIVEKQQTITYNVEVQKKTTLIRLVYSSDGKLISKEKSKIYSFDGTEPIISKPTQSNDGHNHQH